MIYPLLPAFLTGVLKARPAFLGLVEGLAEAVASLLKVASGLLSDRLPRRKPLVVAGYGLSSAVRPLVALAAAPFHVLAVRLLDRVGKGVRSAPRDALLAEITPEGQRGRAFGLQRALDHAGAVVGPLLASALLLAGSDLRTVFALAALPAVLAMAVLVFGVREGQPTSTPPAASGRPGSAAPPPRPPSPLHRGVLAVFSVGTSSAAFLPPKAGGGGVGLVLPPPLGTSHHADKGAASTRGGMRADRRGRK